MATQPNTRTAANLFSCDRSQKNRLTPSPEPVTSADRRRANTGRFMQLAREASRGKLRARRNFRSW